MDRHAKKRACQRDGGSEAGSEAGSNNSDEDIDMKDVRRDLFDAVCFLKMLAMVLTLSSLFHIWHYFPLFLCSYGHNSPFIPGFS